MPKRRKPTKKERSIATVCCRIGKTVGIDASIIVDIAEAWLNNDITRIRVLGEVHGQHKVTNAILEWEQEAKVQHIKVKVKRSVLCP